MHVTGDLARHLTQFVDALRGRCWVSLQSWSILILRCEHLADMVMQLTTDAAPLGFLRVDQTAGQILQQLLCTVCVR